MAGACLDECCATAQHVQGVVLLVGQCGGGHVIGQLVSASLDVGEVLQPRKPQVSQLYYMQPCCCTRGQVNQGKWPQQQRVDGNDNSTSGLQPVQPVPQKYHSAVQTVDSGSTETSLELMLAGCAAKPASPATGLEARLHN